MTLVERASSYVVGGAVGLDCGQNQWQAILDTAPSATLYYSDGEWLKMWVRDKIVS